MSSATSTAACGLAATASSRSSTPAHPPKLRAAHGPVSRFTSAGRDLHPARRPESGRRRVTWLRYAPKDFRSLLQALTAPDGALRREVEALDKRVMERLQSEVGRRYGLASWLPSINKLVDTSVLTESVLGALRDRFPVLGFLPSGGGVGAGLLKLAIFLVLGHGPSANTDVLLCMGPDHAWKLRLRDAQLRADRIGPAAATTSRCMGRKKSGCCACSGQMQGELRTNPSWTIGQRPVTVHAQGGAGMPSKSSTVAPVTDEWGRVRSTSPAPLNQFVVDAAGFPTSVGVNPSLTIAAVAERKVEHFIQTTLLVSPWTNEAAEAPVYWADPGGQVPRPPDNFENLIGSELDELGAKPLSTPNTTPWASSGKSAYKARQRFGTRPRHHAPRDRGVRDGRQARSAARPARQHEAECHTTDLESFYLKRHPSVDLKGTFEVREPPPAARPDAPAPPETAFNCKGHLWLGFRRGRMVTMNYNLTLTGQNSTATGNLIGTNFIHDDPGLDSFFDLTTLHTVLTFSDRPTILGVVRVPMSTSSRNRCRPSSWRTPTTSTTPASCGRRRASANSSSAA